MTTILPLTGFEEILPCDVAHQILGDYLRYHHQYKRINKRAKIRFERRDWLGIQNDATERIDQYEGFVASSSSEIKSLLGDKINNRKVWRKIRFQFLDEIMNFNTRKIAETYYNSVFRHCHKGVGDLDEELMFIKPSVSYIVNRSAVPIFHSLRLIDPIENVVQQIFHLYEIRAPFEDIQRDIGNIAEVIRNEIFDKTKDITKASLELVKSLFFRNKCAYIVGRLVVDHKVQPFIIPLLHEDNGVYADAVLLNTQDAASIFSYSRSYFLADTDVAVDMVEFLHSVVPKKALSELYNSLGFIKHAKTEFYREYVDHMERTEDDFIIAPGIKGMVMTVFTLPSYNMVFKVIKDKFDPPKKVTAKIVKEKYEIVGRHDRVGRMVDSHEFNNLQFELDRFSPELLEELHKTIPSKINIEDGVLSISHLYIEKKLVPLNIYLSKADKEMQVKIILDYGQAIKELARVNIFPGDLLLKNFGVNKRKRVVFYDYDEIEYVTSLKFKSLPQARNEEDEWQQETWFTPDLNDIFPEQFPAFIVGNPDLQKYLTVHQKEIFEAAFWTAIQHKLEAGEIISVFPYDENLRFSNNRKKFKRA